MEKLLEKTDYSPDYSVENNEVENISTDGITPIPAEPPVEAEVSTGKQKLPKKRRAAVCLDCSNEWMAHNGNEKKPSRCPVCGSRRLKWKNEMTDYAAVEKNSTDDGRIEIPPENPVEAEVSTGNPEPPAKPVKPARKPTAKALRKAVEKPVETRGKTVLEKEMTLEEIEDSMPKIPMQAIIFIIGGIAIFAGICFLVRKGKRQFSAHQEPREEQKPTQIILPGIGGNLA